MRRGKRLCACLLTLVLLTGMLPISSVYAAENGDVGPKSVTSSSERVKNDLFRAVYDSDGLFLEEAPAPSQK